MPFFLKKLYFKSSKKKKRSNKQGSISQDDALANEENDSQSIGYDVLTSQQTSCDESKTNSEVVSLEVGDNHNNDLESSCVVTEEKRTSEKSSSTSDFNKDAIEITQNCNCSENRKECTGFVQKYTAPSLAGLEIEDFNCTEKLLSNSVDKKESPEEENKFRSCILDNSCIDLDTEKNLTESLAEETSNNYNPSEELEIYSQQKNNDSFNKKLNSCDENKNKSEIVQSLVVDVANKNNSEPLSLFAEQKRTSDESIDVSDIYFAKCSIKAAHKYKFENQKEETNLLQKSTIIKISSDDSNTHGDKDIAKFPPNKTEQKESMEVENKFLSLILENSSLNSDSEKHINKSKFSMDPLAGDVSVNYICFVHNGTNTHETGGLMAQKTNKVSSQNEENEKLNGPDVLSDFPTPNDMIEILNSLISKVTKVDETSHNVTNGDVICNASTEPEESLTGQHYLSQTNTESILNAATEAPNLYIEQKEVSTGQQCLSQTVLGSLLNASSKAPNANIEPEEASTDKHYSNETVMESLLNASSPATNAYIEPKEVLTEQNYLRERIMESSLNTTNEAVNVYIESEEVSTEQHFLSDKIRESSLNISNETANETIEPNLTSTNQHNLNETILNSPSETIEKLNVYVEPNKISTEQREVSKAFVDNTFIPFNETPIVSIEQGEASTKQQNLSKLIVNSSFNTMTESPNMYIKAIEDSAELPVNETIVDSSFNAPILISNASIEPNEASTNIILSKKSLSNSSYISNERQNASGSDSNLTSDSEDYLCNTLNEGQAIISSIVKCKSLTGEQYADEVPQESMSLLDSSSISDEIDSSEFEFDYPSQSCENIRYTNICGGRNRTASFENLINTYEESSFITEFGECELEQPKELERTSKDNRIPSLTMCFINHALSDLSNINLRKEKELKNEKSSTHELSSYTSELFANDAFNLRDCNEHLDKGSSNCNEQVNANDLSFMKKCGEGNHLNQSITTHSYQNNFISSNDKSFDFGNHIENFRKNQEYSSDDTNNLPLQETIEKGNDSKHTKENSLTNVAELPFQVAQEDKCLLPRAMRETPDLNHTLSDTTTNDKSIPNENKDASERIMSSNSELCLENVNNSTTFNPDNAYITSTSFKTQKVEEMQSIQNTDRPGEYDYHILREAFVNFPFRLGEEVSKTENELDNQNIARTMCETSYDYRTLPDISEVNTIRNTISLENNDTAKRIIFQKSELCREKLSSSLNTEKTYKSTSPCKNIEEIQNDQNNGCSIENDFHILKEAFENFPFHLGEEIKKIKNDTAFPIHIQYSETDKYNPNPSLVVEKSKVLNVEESASAKNKQSIILSEQSNSYLLNQSNKINKDDDQFVDYVKNGVENRTSFEISFGKNEQIEEINLNEDGRNSEFVKDNITNNDQLQPVNKNNADLDLSLNPADEDPKTNACETNINDTGTEKIYFKITPSSESTSGETSNSIDDEHQLRENDNLTLRYARQKDKNMDENDENKYGSLEATDDAFFADKFGVKIIPNISADSVESQSMLDFVNSSGNCLEKVETVGIEKDSENQATVWCFSEEDNSKICFDDQDSSTNNHCEKNKMHFVQNEAEEEIRCKPEDGDVLTKKKSFCNGNFTEIRNFDTFNEEIISDKNKINTTKELIDTHSFSENILKEEVDNDFTVHLNTIKCFEDIISDEEEIHKMQSSVLSEFTDACDLQHLSEEMQKEQDSNMENSHEKNKRCFLTTKMQDNLSDESNNKFQDKHHVSAQKKWDSINVNFMNETGRTEGFIDNETRKHIEESIQNLVTSNINGKDDPSLRSHKGDGCVDDNEKNDDMENIRKILKSESKISTVDNSQKEILFDESNTLTSMNDSLNVGNVEKDEKTRAFLENESGNFISLNDESDEYEIDTENKQNTNFTQVEFEGEVEINTKTDCVSRVLSSESKDSLTLKKVISFNANQKKDSETYLPGDNFDQEIKTLNGESNQTETDTNINRQNKASLMHKDNEYTAATQKYQDLKFIEEMLERESKIHTVRQNQTREPFNESANKLHAINKVNAVNANNQEKDGNSCLFVDCCDEENETHTEECYQTKTVPSTKRKNKASLIHKDNEYTVATQKYQDLKFIEELLERESKIHTVLQNKTRELLNESKNKFQAINNVNSVNANNQKKDSNQYFSGDNYDKDTEMYTEECNQNKTSHVKSKESISLSLKDFENASNTQKYQDIKFFEEILKTESKIHTVHHNINTTLPRDSRKLVTIHKTNIFTDNNPNLRDGDFDDKIKLHTEEYDYTKNASNNQSREFTSLSHKEDVYVSDNQKKQDLKFFQEILERESRIHTVQCSPTKPLQNCSTFSKSINNKNRVYETGMTEDITNNTSKIDSIMKNQKESEHIKLQKCASMNVEKHGCTDDSQNKWEEIEFFDKILENEIKIHTVNHNKYTIIDENQGTVENVHEKSLINQQIKHHQTKDDDKFLRDIPTDGKEIDVNAVQHKDYETFHSENSSDEEFHSTDVYFIELKKSKSCDEPYYTTYEYSSSNDNLEQLKYEEENSYQKQINHDEDSCHELLRKIRDEGKTYSTSEASYLKNFELELLSNIQEQDFHGSENYYELAHEHKEQLSSNYKDNNNDFECFKDNINLSADSNTEADFKCVKFNHLYNMNNEKVRDLLNSDIGKLDTEIFNQTLHSNEIDLLLDAKRKYLYIKQHKNISDCRLLENSEIQRIPESSKTDNIPSERDIFCRVDENETVSTEADVPFHENYKFEFTLGYQDKFKEMQEVNKSENVEDPISSGKIIECKNVMKTNLSRNISELTSSSVEEELGQNLKNLLSENEDKALNNQKEISDIGVPNSRKNIFCDKNNRKINLEQKFYGSTSKTEKDELKGGDSKYLSDSEKVTTLFNHDKLNTDKTRILTNTKPELNDRILKVKSTPKNAHYLKEKDKHTSKNASQSGSVGRNRIINASKAIRTKNRHSERSPERLSPYMASVGMLKEDFRKRYNKRDGGKKESQKVSGSDRKMVEKPRAGRMLSPEVLRARFDDKFNRYARKKKEPCELITYKRSTQWLKDAGIVGSLLTADEADEEFRNLAGVKIALNKQDYRRFLFKLTRLKKLSYKEIYEKLSADFD
nr:protein PF14_0175-like [Parasteatoda tepidariorum]